MAMLGQQAGPQLQVGGLYQNASGRRIVSVSDVYDATPAEVLRQRIVEEKRAANAVQAAAKAKKKAAAKAKKRNRR
jgi:hypothetical protein